MASEGIINATLVHIQVGKVKISNQLSAEMNITMEPRETLNKDSQSWRGRQKGAMSFEMSGEAEFAPDAAFAIDALHDAFVAGTAVGVVFTTNVTGDRQYYGDAVISNLTMSAGVEENVQISYTFAGSGAIAKNNVSAGAQLFFGDLPENGDLLVFDDGEIGEETFVFLTSPAGTSGHIEVEIGIDLETTIDNFVLAFNTEILTYTATADTLSNNVKIESDSEGVQYVVDITTTSTKLELVEKMKS